MHVERTSRWESFGLGIVLHRSFSLRSHNNPLTSGINITIIPLISGTYSRIIVQFLQRSIDNVRTVDSISRISITFKIIREKLTRTHHNFLDNSIHRGIFFIRQIVNIYFSLRRKFEYTFCPKGSVVIPSCSTGKGYKAFIKGKPRITLSVKILIRTEGILK